MCKESSDTTKSWADKVLPWAVSKVLEMQNIDDKDIQVIFGKCISFLYKYLSWERVWTY